MPYDRRRFLRTILGASGAVVLGDGLAWPSTAIPTSRSSGFFIQSNIGTVGNFEVLVPRALGGGLQHFFRNNDDPAELWMGPGVAFGSTDDSFASTLIESSFGNLESIWQQQGLLFHNWRDPNSFRWQIRFQLPNSASPAGRPAFIQGKIGTVGNFEVVAPLSGG